MGGRGGGYVLGCLHSKDSGILESTLGPPYLGKLPHVTWSPWRALM